MNDRLARFSSIVVLISIIWTISPAAYALEYNGVEISTVIEKGEKIICEITPDKDYVIQFDNVKLEIPAGAVKDTIELTIEKIDRVNALNQGMRNVTGGAAGYRFGPHPFTFEKNIKVTLPFRDSAIKSDSDLSNIDTWFYNDELKVWEGLPRHSIDEKNSLVTSLTNHFTDMITSTLTLPESPGPINFNPTSIKELKAADPGAGIPQLEGLEPGPFGGASFSIPFRLPSGRGKATPQLSLSYNSNSSNSWMGKGFDISLPSITTDTRFGLPDYDGLDDYMLNGQALVFEYQIDSSRTKYSQRCEGTFNQIVRFSENGRDWWEVTEKDGTVNVYGSDEAWSGIDAQKVFIWHLKERRDSNGNYITYNYKTVSGYTYPESIVWSGHGSTEGLFKVEFALEDRIDKRIDNRGKYSSKLSKRLRSLAISYNSEVYRVYNFQYENNIFGHSQLLSYNERDGSAKQFFEYSFDYFKLPETDDGYEGFGTEIAEWDTEISRPMEESIAATIGFDLYLGISISFWKFYRWGIRKAPLISFGVSGGFSHTNNWNKSTMADLDGNGLPDLVWQSGSSLLGVMNSGDGFSGTGSVGGFPGILNKSMQNSFSFGTTISASARSGGLKAQRSNSDSNTGLTDINGDGYLDVISKDSGFFSSYQGASEFEQVNWASGMEQGPSRVVSAEELEDYRKSYYIEEPVKRWTSYKPGNIRVEHRIHLLNGSVTSENGVDALFDYPDRDGTEVHRIVSDKSDPDPIIDTFSIDAAEDIYMRLDSRKDVRDLVTDEPDIFADDLYWSTVISYDAIEFFHKASDKQAIFYFPSIYYNIQPPILLGSFYTERDRVEADDPYVWDLNDDAQSALANIPYQSRKAIIDELILLGSFIPKNLTMDQFSTIFDSLTAKNKTAMRILYPYVEKQDRFVLRILDRGNYDDTIRILKQCFSSLTSYFSEDELVVLALPAFDGESQYWDDLGSTVSRTGYSRSTEVSNRLFGSLLAESSNDDIGKSFGFNRVLLDRITEENEGIVYDYFLMKNGDGQYFVREIDGDNNISDISIHVSGSNFSFIRNQVEHIYDISTFDYPEEIESNFFENEIRPLVMDSEIPVLYHIQNLSADYYNDLVVPLETDYITKKNAYETLQNEYDQVLVELAIAEDALNEAISNNVPDVTDLQNAVDALIIQRNGLETPLADAFALYETAEVNYLIYRENYSYDMDRDSYILINTITDEDYKRLLLLSVSDFSPISESLFKTFSGSSVDEFGTSLLSTAERDDLISVVSGLAPENFSLLSNDELPQDYTGDFYILKYNSDSSDNALLTAQLDDYRFFYEKFPYYSLSNGLFIVDDEMTGSQKTEVQSFFESVDITVPRSISTQYLYDENTLFPQEMVTLSSPADIYPATFRDGNQIDGESGDICSVFNFLKIENDASIIKKIYTPVFDSSRDYLAEDVKGAFALYDQNQIDEFYDGEYVYPETGDDPDPGLQDYFEYESEKEHFIGGYRNWYYGFWSAYHEWDTAKIGTETYDSSEIDENTTVPEPGTVDTATPPFFIAAGINSKDESPDEPNVEFEGIGESPLSRDTWIGSISEYCDSKLEIVGDEVQTIYTEYDFVPYMTADNIWHPMRKGGLTYYKTPGQSSSGNGGSGSSLDFIQGSYTSSVNLTYGVGSVNYSRTSGNSKNFKSLMDMNGDRFPDLVTNDNDDSIKIVSGTGTGFSGSTTLSNAYSYLNQYKNTTNSFGISFGGSGSEDIIIASNGLVRVTVAKAEPISSMSFGVNGSKTHSQQSIGLMDINGDGLPDHLTRSGRGNFSSLLNLGDTLSPASWSGGFNEGLNQSVSGSVGATITFGTGPVGLSGGLSGTINNTKFQLLDINGDGLADQVEKIDNTDFFTVRFNYGDTFAPSATRIYCPSWSYTDEMFKSGMQTDMNTIATVGIGSMESSNDLAGSQSIDQIMSNNEYKNDIDPFGINDTINSSTGVSLNLGANLKINISYLLLTFTIQPGVSGSIASTGTSVKMMDMTGNGAPDHLLKAPGDPILRLRINQMDKVGMLTGINLPQGGKYLVEFDRTRNTVLDPNSRWILKTVTKTDGYEDDPDRIGAHSYSNTFTYGLGSYDREEREFLGFNEVTIHLADGSRIAKTYLNNNYDSKGKINSSSFVDSNGKVLNETFYDYAPIFPTGSRSVFYRLIGETSRSYDSLSSLFMETIKNYNYDEYGNIESLESTINGAEEDQNYLLEINYSRLAGHIVGLPISLRTYKGHSAANSKLLRRREADYDGRGNLIHFDKFYGFGNVDSVRTNLEYDEYGNIVKVTDPLGYSQEYVYDKSIHQFVETIRSLNDKGGPVYTSSIEWDYKQGLEIASIEINGNRQEKTYDTFGRLTEIRTSYDTGSLPAVSYSYFTENFPWRTVSSNKVSFDMNNNETIETIVTVDGLGRISQTAKEGEITLPDGSKQHGWNRSGLVVYDSKGRSVKEGQTDFEQNDYSLPITVDDFPATSELIRETEKTYDNLDRVVEIKLPDGAVMTSSYTLGRASLSGSGDCYSGNEVLQSVIQTDPLGNVTEVWKNGRGMIVAIVKKDSHNRVMTEATYNYSLLGELLERSDYEGNNVSFEYDLLGRQLSVDSPDSGRREFQYNEAGLLWRKNDSKLKEQGVWIEYEYDYHNRLSLINYPESTDVSYVYGTNPSLNNVGRLSQVSNESGTTTYEYGKMGEISSVSRTLNRLTPNSDSETAIMSYQSDYLGRMESITYPDGEILTYDYDQGGQIVSATGDKNRTEFKYIDDIGYDEYGQRVYIRYGNGTETSYSYDENRRWLDNIETGLTSSSVKYQDMNYRFDAAGNILSIVNDTFNNSVRQDYSYDALYQLTSAEGQYDFHNTGGSITSSSTYVQSFSYDQIGNMLSKTSGETISPPTGVSPLDYNNLYSYYSDAPHRVERIGEIYYRYDQNGNTVEERMGGHREEETSGGSTYTYVGEVTIADSAFAWNRSEDGSDDNIYSRQFYWDEEDRLKGTTDPSHWTQYTYDHDGERTVKYSDLGETLYFNSMWSMSDSWASLGLRQSKNIYIGETRVATKLNYKDSTDYGYENVNTYYYHSDHLGSSSVITDPNGDVYEHLEYTPYGEIWVEDQNAETLDKIPYRFTGKEWDEETKLYYMSARYQNPMTSRWMSADPAIFTLVNPMDEQGSLRSGFNIVESMNLFSYVSNNPLMYIDPTGLAEIEADKINSDEFHDNSGTLRSPEYLDGRLAEEAEKSVDDNYVFGGKPDNDKGGLDCSGFAEKLMEQISGVKVRERNADGQATDPNLTLPGNGSKGSLNFYDWKGNGNFDHVAVDLGNGNIINPKGGADNTSSNPGIIEKRGPFNTPPVNRKVNWRYLILE